MTIKSYAEAINDAHRQLLETDERVFVLGQGVDSPWCVGKTTLGLVGDFGSRRVRDTPIAENAMTGSAIGAAMAGLRPIVFHPRMDFMYFALDQIINHGAHWHYMFGGQVNVPVTIRGIVNRGNEQAAQHSQSPYSMYAHIPGLKVVVPASPYDAKGLFISAVRDNNPVIISDDRWLYELKEEVPDEMYEVPLGKGKICRKGSDITIVAIGYMVPESLAAAEALEKDGISVEVIDPRTLKPLDEKIIIDSVVKTGRLIVADPEWPCCGLADHIVSVISRKAFSSLLTPPSMVTLPDAPAPASSPLEKAYFPRQMEIYQEVKRILS